MGILLLRLPESLQEIVPAAGGWIESLGVTSRRS